MSWLLVVGAAWIVASVAAALGIGRAIAIADRKAAEGAPASGRARGPAG